MRGGFDGVCVCVLFFRRSRATGSGRAQNQPQYVAVLRFPVIVGVCACAMLILGIREIVQAHLQLKASKCKETAEAEQKDLHTAVNKLGKSIDKVRDVPLLRRWVAG